MKSYTNIEESKKLAKFLPLESADMWWADGLIIARNSVIEPDDIKSVIPCWSLAALLGVLPYPYIEENYRGKWTCKVEQGNTTYLWEAPNPIDACYEMIVKLHEKNELVL